MSQSRRHGPRRGDHTPPCERRTGASGHAHEHTGRRKQPPADWRGTPLCSAVVIMGAAAGPPPSLQPASDRRDPSVLDEASALPRGCNPRCHPTVRSWSTQRLRRRVAAIARAHGGRRGQRRSAVGPRVGRESAHGTADVVCSWTPMRSWIRSELPERLQPDLDGRAISSSVPGIVSGAWHGHARAANRCWAHRAEPRSGATPHRPRAMRARGAPGLLELGGIADRRIGRPLGDGSASGRRGLADRTRSR